MTDGPGTNGEPRPGSDEDTAWMTDAAAQTWMAEHVPGLRRAVSSHRYLYWSLAIAFVLGLVLQVVGYVARTSTPQEPLGLFADLAYALGLALWTGVVVTVFVDIVPEAKERQVRRAIAVYDAAMRERAQKRD